jgi:hypothetical protein
MAFTIVQALIAKHGADFIVQFLDVGFDGHFDSSF